MTGNKFDGQTTWEDTDQFISSWNGGWEAPGQDFVIDKEDSFYWDTNLRKAQEAYGDPNIRYNSDDTGAERYLQFGDGTRVPADGTLVYRDSASNQNWINNGDGTFTKADQNFQPTGQPLPPAGFRRMADGKYAPIDARGNQVGALNPQPANFPGSPGWHEAGGVATPLNTNGDYYEIDPATGQNKYFDKTGQPISKEKYFAGTPFPQPGQAPGRPPAPGSGAPLQSTQVSVPDGMTAPEYPEWATEVDPDVPNQMTGVVVRLYELFGSGSPATSELPEFPFSTDTGEKSGIDAYDTVKGDFKRIESQFDSAAQAFKDAVQTSANVTQAGRDAINNAIATFNTTAKSLDEGDWDGLLQAESTMLDTVKSKVESSANTQQNVPSNPSGGPGSPMTPPAPVSAMPPADASLAAPPTDENKDLKDLLGGMGGSPFGGGMPMGGNPLGALGGMNPLGGGGGSPMGGGGNPLSSLSDAVKPLSKLSDTDGKGEDKKPAITPLNPGPQNAPPPPATSPAAAPADPAAVAAGTPGQPGPAKEPAATPAGNSTTTGAKPTVTLPDGRVIEAPNKQAAEGAQNAIDNASPGGDAAQKAYSPTGLDLPGDGKNLGAKVDPSDAQAGDVLKWQDKTMVMAGPGLVADPHEPGVTHTLEEVLKDQKGFQGLFRPTETDPTLSTHTSAPPLTDPQAPPTPPGQPTPPPPADNDRTPPAPTPPSPPPTSVPAEPPPDSVPLSGPGPAGAPAAPQAPAPQPSATVPQPAPPSPFEDDAPPPAARSTKSERIAAGLE